MPKSMLQVAQERARAGNSEHVDQALFFRWLWALPESKYPGARAAYAIPNAGKPGRAEREGLNPGTPDVCIPVPAVTGELTGDVFGALYIEFKRASYYSDALRGVRVDQTRPTRAQYDRLLELRAAGNACAVCYGLEAGQQVVETYYRVLRGTLVIPRELARVFVWSPPPVPVRVLPLTTWPRP